MSPGQRGVRLDGILRSRRALTAIAGFLGAGALASSVCVVFPAGAIAGSSGRGLSSVEGGRPGRIRLPALPAPPSGFGPTASPGVCSGVEVSVQARLDVLVSNYGPGTTFCLSPGIHRIGTPVVPKPNDQFIGQAGAILDGSEDISAQFTPVATSNGRVWASPNQMEQETPKGICSGGSESCRFAHAVFYDNRPLNRVMTLADLRPGSFFFDYAEHAIYVADNPAGHRVDVAVSVGAFQGWMTSAVDVTIRNLTIQKFANVAQVGAISCGVGWIVENNDIRLNHGAGLEGGDLVTGNFIHDNGQLGINGRGGVIEHNEISFNNTAGFSGRWEAGGAKFTGANDLLVEDNYVHDNDGPGLWSDTDNIDVTYRGNYVANNALEGILHEISYNALIEDNVVTNNGFGSKSGWLEGAGILILSSPNVEIRANTVMNNLNGITIEQTDRGVGRYGPYESTDISVDDNVIVMKRGQTGLAQGVNDPSYFTDRGNRFAGNTYYLGCSTTPFAWRSPAGRMYDGKLSTSEWIRVGNDRRGTFRSVCAR